MQPRARQAALAVAALAVLAGALLVGAAHLPATTSLDGSTYDAAEVTVETPDGTVLGTVDARVADTDDERYTGLSDTEALPRDAGMLFVFHTEGRHAFVMREMAFPLDIVFVAANGTITEIHEAPVPPANASGSALTRYAGTGKWVLEVNRNWTDRHGVSEGDRVDIEYENATNATETAG